MHTNFIKVTEIRSIHPEKMTLKYLFERVEHIKIVIRDISFVIYFLAAKLVYSQRIPAARFFESQF